MKKNVSREKQIRESIEKCKDYSELLSETQKVFKIISSKNNEKFKNILIECRFKLFDVEIHTQNFVVVSIREVKRGMVIYYLDRNKDLTIPEKQLVEDVEISKILIGEYRLNPTRAIKNIYKRHFHTEE